MLVSQSKQRLFFLTGQQQSSSQKWLWKRSSLERMCLYARGECTTKQSSSLSTSRTSNSRKPSQCSLIYNDQAVIIIGVLQVVMGCISQNGCLGPRRREKEVFAELVEAIFAQAQRVADDGSSYEAVRARVGKRGVLRKLLDHLLSHKNKIGDCLNYTLRLVSQTSSLTRKFAGLLIVDDITTQIYRVSRQEVAEEGRTIARSGSSQGLVGGEVKVGADLRFDLAYFRLVIQLLEAEKETLVEPVLSSIINFCYGRKERIGCRTEVWRTLELLLTLLQTEKGRENAARCYLLLLELLREGGKEEGAHEGDLLIFLRLWQREDEREPESASEQGLKVTIFRIIKMFVGRCLTAWDAKVLFRSLFELYSEERVGVVRLAAVEQMVLGIVRQSDLHAHILRGLFQYLLQFLSAAPIDRTSFRSSFQEEFDAHRHPHIYDRRIRLRLFETLRRWSQKGYINLDECVAFGSASLVRAYITNLRGQRDYVQEVVREFFRLSQALSPASNLIVVGVLMQEMKGEKTEQGVRKVLVGLAREVLESRKLLEGSGQDWSTLFVPLEPFFSKETRLDLIQLMGFVVQHLSLEQLSIDHEQTNPLIGSVCEVLHSLHEGAKWLGGRSKMREEQDMLYRYQYTNCILSFLRCFVEKYAYLQVLCFIGAVADRFGLETDASSTSLYFDLYLIYQAMHLINPKHKLPQRMVSINFKISPSARTADIKQEIELFMKQLGGAKGELYSQQRSKISKEIVKLREFTMVSESDFRQMQMAFLTCFKNTQKPDALPLKQESFLFTAPFKGENSRSQFKRESLNGSFYESAHERSRNDDDESFRDIVDRIIDN